jgi:ribonuclease HI
VAHVVERAVRLLEDWNFANNLSPTLSNTRAAAYDSSRTGLHHSSVQQQRHTIHTSGTAAANAHNTAQPRWQPPSRGRVKCNMDAAFSEQLNRTGIGVCIRDEFGTFILAKIIPISPKLSVDTGEALALYHALEWLSDMAFDSVDFCSDSKSIIDAFNQSRMDVTETGHILSACRHLFQAHFTNSKVEFNRRQANEVAHTLAGVATLSASPKVYYHIPRCIEHIIINEML